MAKSYRDIKSSLDMSREKRVVSRTAQIEMAIVKQIEDRYGKILESDSNDMVLRERARKQKQIESLELSRLRLFINKERRSRLQKERLHPYQSPETQLQGKNPPPEKLPDPIDEASKFKRMELKY